MIADEFDLADEAATDKLGRCVAAALAAGDTICLSGPLGAGKSTLARALVRTLTRLDEEVPSPTFTLVQQYEGGSFPIAHFDLYRLERPEEVEELGLEEALDVGAAVIEWPQRLEGRLPPDRLDIEISFQGDGRRARLTPHGAWERRDFKFRP